MIAGDLRYGVYEYMQAIENLKINSVELIDGAIIQIALNCDWPQESTAKIAKLVVTQANGAAEFEHILGADRESFRIQWRQQFFSLHFECYSQSCWLEADEAASQELIYELYAQLA